MQPVSPLEVFQRQNQHEEFITAMERFETSQRELAHRYAWLLCGCRRWPDPEERDVPPQAGCIVHGQMIVTRDGRVL